MAAKEPTVEGERIRDQAETLVDRASQGWGIHHGHYAALVDAVAKALAVAEQAASERAWDEGAEAALDYVMFRDKSLRNDVPGLNPYRLPKGPTK